MMEIMISLLDKLECMFCYLGDLIGAGGGAEEASRARVRCALANFRELAPVLTSSVASLNGESKSIQGLYPDMRVKLGL